MAERKAVKYGQVQIIQGVICDGYILEDGTPVLSERGTANLLGMDHKALQNMATNEHSKSLGNSIHKTLNVATNHILSRKLQSQKRRPKILELYLDPNLKIVPTMIKVTASNSSHKGQDICVYDSYIVESLISGYALAFANDMLRENQKHIGRRCVILQSALIRTALDTAIKEACGYTPNIQETAQQHCNNLINLIKEAGFVSSVSDEIATKKDIAKFLKVPESTLTSFLRKYHTDIKPVKLDNAAIKAIGSRAKRMFGYWMEDVAKIVLGMDSEVTAQLKNKMFGQLGNFANMQSKSEVQWRIALARVFEKFDLKYNYQLQEYRLDFFVKDLKLVLECNGFAHAHYDLVKEAEREKLILKKKYSLVRFHHQATLEAVVNAVLRVLGKPGEKLIVYDEKDLCKAKP